MTLSLGTERGMTILMGSRIMFFAQRDMGLLVGKLIEVI